MRIRLGIYQPNQQTVEVQSDSTGSTTTANTSSTTQPTQQQQQQNQEAFRLSGSEFSKSFGNRNDVAFGSSSFMSSSSLAISGVGSNAGGKEAISATANSIGGGSNLNANIGESFVVGQFAKIDSPTPPTQHRRLAKSFSVAPSLSQTKGVQTISFLFYLFQSFFFHSKFCYILRVRCVHCQVSWRI